MSVLDQQIQSNQQQSTQNINNHLRVVVRKLPPNLPQEIFYQSIQPWVNDDTITQTYYSKGKLRATNCNNTSESNKEHVASRAYITFKTLSNLYNFHSAFDGHIYKDKQGRQSRISIEFAPFQKTPTPKLKVDHRQNTIEDDPDYKSFLQTLESTPVKPDFEANLQATKAVDKPKQTPLLLHLAAKTEKQRIKREKSKAKAIRRQQNQQSNVGTSKGGGGEKSSKKPKSSNTRPKQTRGEKRAAKKAREASTVPNPQLKPPSNQPIKILARQSEQPKSQSTPNNNNNNNTSQPQLLKPPTGPKRSPNQSPSPSPSKPLQPPRGPKGGNSNRGRGSSNPPRGGRGKPTSSSRGKSFSQPRGEGGNRGSKE